MKLVELRCKNCGALLKENAEESEITCKYCQSKFKLDDEVQHVKYDDMEQSGYEFEKGRLRAQQEYNSNTTNNTISNMNPIVEFIIIFFFGSLGVHKFMKGQIGMGILYLFTGGIFGIGWLIDIIKAAINLSNKNTASN